jgi:hypothetical protein
MAGLAGLMAQLLANPKRQAGRHLSIKDKKDLDATELAKGDASSG